jgi:RNA polymerase sigma-70 factor (ECF subfamily)
MGVPDGQVDDALQDVFLVVLRRFDEYVVDSHCRAWLFEIALRVARGYRRSNRRRNCRLVSVERDLLDESGTDSPFERAARAQALVLLQQFLDQVQDEKRKVFIMTEFGQMSAPEIASSLSINLNTVYARIRAARREFARSIAEREPARLSRAFRSSSVG